MAQQQRHPVLIAGSSHVRRLGQHVSALPNGNFNITAVPLDAIFFGIGGWKLENEQHVADIENEIQRRHPYCLLLHIRGNDLDTTDLDDILCQRLALKLASWLRHSLYGTIFSLFLCMNFSLVKLRGTSAQKNITNTNDYSISC